MYSSVMLPQCRCKYFPMIFTIWLTLRWKIITRTPLLFCIYICKHRNPIVLLLCCGAKNTNTKLNKDHLQSLGYMCASARSCVCLLCQCAMNVWHWTAVSLIHWRFLASFFVSNFIISWKTDRFVIRRTVLCCLLTNKVNKKN